ncbi:hypothetical protein AU074_14635 [Pseudomonas sp. ATCC PTA-122608]|nr:hypothetical protein AU074_14635 [Pseudomonas sp. ATCC PTA-122608]
MVGLAQRGQMPTDATQRCVYDMAPGICRSELAREKPVGAARVQAALVIVDVFREQARSYRD